MKLDNVNDSNVSSIYNRVMTDMDTAQITPGVEGMINDVFYKVDKKIQGSVKGVINYFSTINIVIDDLHRYKTKTPNINNLVSLQSDLVAMMNSGQKFHSTAERKTPVLLGLNIKLNEVLDIVRNNSGYIKGLGDNLRTFDAVLDDLLNSRKDNIHINIDTDNVNAINRHLVLINKDIAKVTNNKVVSDRLPIKKVVSNFKELNTITRESIMLGEVYKMENLEDLYEFNEELAVKLEAIHKSFGRDDVTIAKNDLQEFINYINTMAKYLTAVAFLFYLYYQLTNMVTGVIKVIAMEKPKDVNMVNNLAAIIKDGYKSIVKFTK